jgi:ABC-type nickel/cobalt efflux system permease component RcnA
MFTLFGRRPLGGSLANAPPGGRRLNGWLALFAVIISAPAASAHPVGERTYDRAIVVRLGADRVSVEYELEVNTATVAQDLADLGEEIDLSRCRQPRDYYEAFVKFHAPFLARNLDARLDGRPLAFAPVSHDFEVREKVSLHCRFRFRAPWQPAAGQTHRLTFKEGNYEERSGRIALSLESDGSVALRDVVAPSTELQAKPLTLLAPGEADQLREASASFDVPAVAATGPATESPDEAAVERGGQTEPPPSPWDATGLADLLFHRNEGLWVLMAVAAVLGAGHALTPGHGKTLVAAYLIGERGTVYHALFLGLMTTLSHTGAIIAIAVAVELFCGGRVPPALQPMLGVGGGLLVAGMGVWLLLARLSGRADHVHLFGGHHHHHDHSHGHDHADHYHDEHGHAHPLPGERVGWGRLALLGVAGGIIPCHDAIWLYLALVSAGLLAFALPLLLAFSAGLAAVLVAIGIAVVKAKGLAGKRWGASRAFKALPIISAVLVICVGLWLCYSSLPTIPGR